MTHPLSLAFLTTFDLGPAEAVRVAARAGYQMVGLRLLPATPVEADYPLLTEDRVLAEVLAAVDETGVTVGDVEIIRLKADCDWDLFERFCARAEALGARHVLVAGDDPDEGRLTESFARFCDLAAAHGLTADLEFMPWTKVPDLAAARRVVEGAGRANGGILIDAIHYDRSATTLAEIAALPPGLIHYVQFCDGPVPFDPAVDALTRVARGERLMPGEGGIDLEGLARLVPPGVTISLEIPNLALAKVLAPEPRARRALEAQRALLARIGRV